MSTLKTRDEIKFLVTIDEIKILAVLCCYEGLENCNLIASLEKGEADHVKLRVLEKAEGLAEEYIEKKIKEIL